MLHKKVDALVSRVTAHLPEKRRHDLHEKLEALHRRGLLPTAALGEAARAVEEEEEPVDPFPSLEDLPVEDVVKRWYDWDKKAWESAPAKVKIQTKHFSEGGMRTAHFMHLIHPDGTAERMVAKRQKSGTNDPEEYDTDVVMQAACQAVAKAFNQYDPIKRVEFVDCFVVMRKDKTWWGVESYLLGKYVKYNNNFGFVGKDARNTPQAFSHFSYQYTQGKLMIVDIQGVGDKYTDPQIHTSDGKGYGQGNMGPMGIERFLKSHWCNPICLSLKLPFHTPRKFGIHLHKSPKDSGTVQNRTPGTIVTAKVGDFLGDVRPAPDGASAEDLALLGLSSRAFNQLVDVFNQLDKDHSGFLDKEELYVVFQKAKVGGTKSKNFEEFVAFASRVESQLNAEGRLSFKAFLLCWTDNQ